MTHEEHERAAYMAGDTVTAGLYHRLEELKEKHTDALAEVEGLTDALAEANEYAAGLQRELDKATS